MRKRLAFYTVLATLTGMNAHAQDAPAPVVLELFTSQGCSSCPPADALLREIVQADTRIIALSYHVDYWDYLGWRDPYALPESTARQRGYAAALGTGVFTPQLVTQGSLSAVGSNKADVAKAIAKASPIAALSLSYMDGQVAMTCPTSSVSGARLVAVTYDRITRTDVERGENAGRVLDSLHSVRSIKDFGACNDGLSSVPYTRSDKTGLALLLQKPNGPVLAAGSFE